ncbi:cellulase N-terminal Ig-like domain-containing protein, partial [Actinoplanes sp. NPDC051633]|uniref:cellulase N-terminal Ig-like domain-containing protein n=1 Tax=Actinoplanes sp. NPDC051633 TaxID=3155670 RepID=UPI003429F96F
MSLRVGLVLVLIGAGLTVPASPALADEVEQVVNGGFDGTTDPWWSSPGMPISLESGRACVTVAGGTPNRWNLAIGQNGIDLVAGESYRLSFWAAGDPEGHNVGAVVGLSVPPYPTYFEASPALTASGAAYTYTFTASTSTDQGQVSFQLGGGEEAFRFCLDDVSLVGGVAPPGPYEPETGPRVRVNQVAYLPAGPKRATLVTDATTPMRWELRDRNNQIVLNGRTVPRGVDASSG